MWSVFFTGFKLKSVLHLNLNTVNGLGHSFTSILCIIMLYKTDSYPTYMKYFMYKEYSVWTEWGGTPKVNKYHTHNSQNIH